ncbi:MAG: tripartite tricarboxylate transporter substrate binding protein [Microvirga sp.]|nr:tripartite tricarboxylate transporter substrate binding protein [Microvirga sp.]
MLGVNGASAQDYPSQTIRVVVPYAAGGGTDAIARVVTSALSEVLGQTMIVENRTGGATAIGTQYVARATPDGYTLMVGGPSNLSVLPALDPAAAGYDIFTEFAPIGMMYSAPNVIVVRSDLPIEDLDDLVAYARENPRQLRYGSTGVGSFQHLGPALLEAMSDGMEISHIPYQGLGEVIPALLSGEVQFAQSSFNPVLPHIESGALRAIAITGEDRVAVLPDVSTTVEQGYPDLVFDARVTMVAPAGTPEDRLDIIREALKKALESEAVLTFFANNGATVVVPDAAELTRFYKADQERFRKAGRAAGVYKGD